MSVWRNGGFGNCHLCCRETTFIPLSYFVREFGERNVGGPGLREVLNCLHCSLR